MYDPFSRGCGLALVHTNLPSGKPFSVINPTYGIGKERASETVRPGYLLLKASIFPIGEISPYLFGRCVV